MGPFCLRYTLQSTFPSDLDKPMRICFTDLQALDRDGLEYCFIRGVGRSWHILKVIVHGSMYRPAVENFNLYLLVLQM